MPHALFFTDPRSERHQESSSMGPASHRITACEPTQPGSACLVASSRLVASAPRPASEIPSFDSVYDQYLPYVWRTLERMGVPRCHLEDAAQEVFIVVYRQLAEFEGRATIKTWLFSITFRVSKEWLRRSRRSRSEELPTEVRDDRVPGPFEGAVRNQAVAMLHEVLSTLHPDKRAAFILGELEQMSVPEIAAALGANVNTIASRLRAARREFDAAVERRAARQPRRPA